MTDEEVFVALKPSAVLHGTSVYDSPRSRYRPNPSAMSSLLQTWPASVQNRLGLPDAARQLATALDVNILGGAFLAGITALSYALRPLFPVFVQADDPILPFLYPDLEEPDRASVADAIRANNTGPFALFAVKSANHSSLSAALGELVELKSSYRKAIDLHVPACPTLVRDNLVHTPARPEEVCSHFESFVRLAFGSCD